jgi:hypothetical protein
MIDDHPRAGSRGHHSIRRTGATFVRAARTVGARGVSQSASSSMGLEK